MHQKVLDHLVYLCLFGYEKNYFKKNFLFDKLKKHDENFNEIDKIKFSEHHYSHAASAFYPSPFKNAIVLTLDGVGEWATTTVALGQKNNLKMLKEIYLFSTLFRLVVFSFYLLHWVQSK